MVKRCLRRLSRLSLRSRLILLGAAGLAVGLAFGGFVLVTVLRASLERTVDSAATQTARDVAALIDANRLPDPIPAGGTTVVQVVDDSGRVRAASAGADRLVPGLGTEQLRAVQRGDAGYLPGYLFGVSGVVRVVAVQAGPVDDQQTVIVATPASDVAESVQIVQIGLLIGFGLLLLVLVALAWRIVGATLRPVEALRLGAEKITGTGLAGSLPVPESQDEIAALAKTLNRMLSRLDRSSNRQRAFVADAAHELRSPLTSLRTQIEVQHATGVTDTSDLLTEVERMSRLVDDLLVLARIDESVPARHEPTDLAALARQVVGRYSGARVPVSVAESSGEPVSVDSRALDRALANLIDNAVRYASTAVAVGVRSEGPDEVVLTVADDGPGIAVADRDRVFDRFTRLADARDRDSGGSGLGLAIVGELIAAQGGTVALRDVDPAPVAGHERGLLVEVRLQLALKAR
ncbi:MAG: HAMP domain-containing histidine kinase [Geodermatophilaceae bacterium]|nr:HAMP domain-containing histidine kinase [Geodermatophilaceae bacterium]